MRQTTYMSCATYMSYRGQAATKKEAQLCRKTGDWHHFPVSHLIVT